MLLPKIDVSFSASINQLITVIGSGFTPVTTTINDVEYSLALITVSRSTGDNLDYIYRDLKSGKVIQITAVPVANIT